MNNNDDLIIKLSDIFSGEKDIRLIVRRIFFLLKEMKWNVNVFTIAIPDNIEKPTVLLSNSYESRSSNIDESIEEFHISKFKIGEERPGVLCFEDVSHEIIITTDYRNKDYKRLFPKSKQTIEAKHGYSYQSHIYYRLQIRNEKLGYIAVQSELKNAFDKEHENIMKLIGRFVSPFIFQYKFHQTFYRTISKVSYDISNAIIKQDLTEDNALESSQVKHIKETKLLEIFKNVINNLKDETDCVAIGFVEPVNNNQFELNMVVEEKLGKSDIPRDKIISKDIDRQKVIFRHQFLSKQNNYPGIWCIKNRKPVFINHKKEYDDYGLIYYDAEEGQGIDSQSIIYCPLFEKSNKLSPFGVLSIQSEKEFAFTDFDFNILQAISSSFEDIYSIEKENKEKDVLIETHKLFGDLGNNFLKDYAASGELSKEIVTTIGVNLAKNLFKIDPCDFHFSICILNENEGCLEISAFEKNAFETEKMYDLKDTTRPAVICFNSEVELYEGNWIKNFKKHGAPQLGVPVVGDDSFHTVLYLPIKDSHQEKPWGVISAQSTQVHQFTVLQRNQFKFFSEYLGAAIISVKRRNVEKQQKLLVDLTEIGKSITANLEIPDMFQFTVNVYYDVKKMVCANNTKTFGFNIYLISETTIDALDLWVVENGEKVFDKSEIKDRTNTYSIEDKHRPAICCFNEKEFIHYKDWRTDYKAHYEKYGIPNEKRQPPSGGDDTNTLVFIPLLDGDENSLGVISTQSTETDAFSEFQIELLKTLSEYIGITIHNSRTNTKLKRTSTKLESTNTRLKNILEGIMPKNVANIISNDEKYPPKHHKNVTIMFVDFVGFTEKVRDNEEADKTKPQVFTTLEKHFSKFNQICKTRNLTKIKTIGDSFMCAGGVPESRNSNLIETVLAALEIRDYMKSEEIQDDERFEVRIGIHNGDVIAGVISGYTYDLWGATVNKASRIESIKCKNLSCDTWFEEQDYNKNKIESCRTNKICVSIESWKDYHLDKYFEKECRFLGVAKNDEIFPVIAVKQIKEKFGSRESGYLKPKNSLIEEIESMNK